MAAAIIDESIGRAIQAGRQEQVWSAAVELKTRFKKPIPLDCELRVVARITGEGSRFFEGEAELVLPDGQVAATGEGKYLKVDLERIGDFDEQANEWRVVPSEADPEEIVV